jgi:putative ABC transport system permease protein
MRLFADFRYACRTLISTPGFTITAVLCLALGIGATSAMFSLVNAVLLRPLGYREPDKLIRLYTEFPNFPNGGLRRFWTSVPEWDELTHELDSFSSIGAWVTGGANLSASNDPQRINVTAVTGELFDTLGVSPIIGRTITKGDAAYGAPAVAVLSYNFFQHAFGGDPAVLHRVVKVDGLNANIIGVMPPGFTFPPGDLDPSDAWLPLQIGPELRARAGHFLNLVGRLKPGVSLSRAKDEITRHVADSPSRIAIHPFSPDGHPIVAYPFHGETVRGVTPALWTLLAAVWFVLLIACVNVANLLLARAEGRQQETAVRRAMGAGTAQLVRQFAMEGFVLSLAGGALGLGLAMGLVHTVAKAGASTIPRANEIGVDLSVVAVTAGILLGTTLVFALAPLAPLSGVHDAGVHDALKAAGTRTTGTVGSQRFRAVLVAGELALALVLLIGTGLMLRTFWNLADVRLGYNPERLLTAHIELPGEMYKTPRDVVRFWERVQEKMSRLPQVLSATVMSGLPPERPINANDTFIEGFQPVPGGPGHNIDYWQSVGERFFETTGTRLIEGRYFDDRELLGTNLTVIVNRTMARTYYGNNSALGKRLQTGGPKSQFLTIVGVVEDIKNAGLDRPAGTEIFLPYHQGNERRNLVVMLRTAGDPRSVEGALRSAVLGIDPEMAISQVRPMDEVLAGAKSRPRFLATLLGAFSGAALLLAAVGLYGVIAYSVARRTPEFGIRIAIGANTGQIFGLVLGHGLKLALAGIALGALGAFALTRLMQGLLYGVSSFDPLTLVTMSLVLVAITLVACAVPARRATQSDPMTALRYE